MTKQTEAMKLALEALEMYGKRHRATYLLGGAWDEEITLGGKAITALEETLQEHAMQEVQRLGQEIEQCQCTECQIKPHASDCAVHSEPAYPKGKCDCGAQLEEKPVAKYMGETYLYLYKDILVGTLLYTTPPQRKPLTDKAITQVIDSMPKKMKGFMVDWDLYEFARAIEAKLKEKNT